MNQGCSQPQRGFTLIEMMTVMTIIIILMAVTVGGMGYVRGKQDRSRAQVEIKLLESGIEAYQVDNGGYPGDDIDADGGELSSQVLYNALFFDGYDSRQDGDSSNDITIYLPELDPRNSKQTWVRKSSDDEVDEDLDIKDPWGRPYRYRNGMRGQNNSAQNPDFDLWSVGKDGETDDDPRADVAKDDIGNF